MENWFYPLNQTVDSGDFKFKDIDFSWLKTFKSNVYCLMNIASQVSSCPTVPNGKDLYIFSWFFEPFDAHWLFDIYQSNPQAEFVVITDLNPNFLNHYPRVKCFKIFHHTTWIDAIKYKNTRPINTNLFTRKYKLSSLCSRLNEFKFYVTAKLYSKNNPQTFYTWNRGFEIRSNDQFVFEPKDFLHSDSLLVYKELLKHNRINAEKFKNTPLNNSCFDHPAYFNTIINSVNETQSLSIIPDFGKVPTPYITEKTWKPLFAGNALLFTGQAGLKKQLESWGFRFDYVWAQDYDNSFNDDLRIEVVLSQINWILETPIDVLAQAAQSSTDFNTELAWSGKLENYFLQHNEQEIENIRRYINCR